MIKKTLLVFMLLIIASIQAQKITIKGIVSDKDGALPGVSVLIKGTTTRADTDFDGAYTIKAKEGDVLVYSYLGYETIEIMVALEKIINVTLKEGGELLDEIVVASYGRKLSKRKSAAALVTLKGRISGISISKKSDSGYMEETFKPQSGQLTAAEINDLEKWDEWKKLSHKQDFIKEEKNWKFDLGEKLEVFVVNNNQEPIINAKVFLIDDQKNIKQGVTDVFGKAVFLKNSSQFFTIQTFYNKQVKGKRLYRDISKTIFQYHSVSKKIKGLDVMFTIDATGSMGDEISYLKSEIENIITRVDSTIKEKRIALTFYRDLTDSYVVKDFDFSSNIIEVKDNLSKQRAEGGGDYEEAVEIALKKSLSMNWRENAKTKLMFLMLDAPPHLNQENIKIIKEQINKAKSMGIKIIPIVASDSNKSVEYLMRYFSVYTNGTYVFLTDDSGIGNKHMKPSAKDFKVEKLNDLIVRLINKYSGV
tara:strand:+ start:352 stop:1782 length:1431 start_codon:yes stop_codon:yes gene_type:complete